MAGLTYLSPAAGLLWAQLAAAFDFVPLGEGILPSGEILSTFQITFAPGDAVPWHFHAGPTWAVIVSGTLTEERGCGSEPLVHPAGSTLTVKPGVVHRELNLGTVPAVVTVVTVVPPCYNNYNSAIYGNGPRCEGNSGHSQVEKVPPCGPAEIHDADASEKEGAVGGEQQRVESATPPQIPVLEKPSAPPASK